LLDCRCFQSEHSANTLLAVEGLPDYRFKKYGLDAYNVKDATGKYMQFNTGCHYVYQLPDDPENDPVIQFLWLETRIGALQQA
jgi:hypothetical protein